MKNQDFQLCADLGLSDFVRRWATNNPETIAPAISHLGVLIQTGKTSRVSPAYLDLVCNIFSKTLKETKRAALIAFTELSQIQREKETS